MVEETRCRHMGYSFQLTASGFFPQTGEHIPWPLLHQSWNTDWNDSAAETYLILAESYPSTPVAENMAS